MRKILWVSFCVLLAAGLGLGQALSRVTGKVTNTKGEGVAGVKISITQKDSAQFSKEITTDADGTYEVSFTDGTKVYVFTLSADGYIGFKEDVKPKIFASMEHDFTIKTREEVEKLLRAEEMKKNPHLALFEEGRQAYLAGNLVAARKAFDECLKAKPDFTKVNVFLADIDLKENKLDEAIARAEKTMGGPDEEKVIALRILINAYQQKGKKDKAMECQKQLEVLQPDSPESLYNKAVEFLNKKDDAGAKPLLEKAIEVDSEFSEAYYELGFIYLREGDMAKSKATFETFLKLSPTGEKAETAKETIKWL